ncbi:hypothetical protein L226DRAFT_541244 [Lentinus tigrinus ALCF2SS1-7]|uniref:uncharacterized protein n=1 Tax=Lentinus tigrinus ALCF2SS1-7 TaxID=1328758 RepID=UPI001165CE31|nr:hypothetical protein L226DRAFT_541244 [Lentinus tigrinus ALCF2SS1-7]
MLPTPFPPSNPPRARDHDCPSPPNRGAPTIVSPRCTHRRAPTGYGGNRAVGCRVIVSHPQPRPSQKLRSPRQSLDGLRYALLVAATVVWRAV